ncbi:MAG TPA: hypothetical protein VLZ54_01005 [Arenibacter sp.]|nr:hypothetical protein [Arenibacter sp.]
MKQVVLFVAILMLIKPLWPLAEYVVNYDYIVENLCENKDRPFLNCDGKCYLAKQLAKESEGGDKNPFESRFSKTDIQFVVSFDASFHLEWDNTDYSTLLHNFKTPRDLFSTLFQTDLAQPPERA